jgi:TIGR03009 family protein
MKQLLKSWEQNSARLKTLDVRIDRIDRFPAWDAKSFEGRAILKSPNLAWLEFHKVRIDPATGQKTKAPEAEERIVCTGNEVWHYKIPEKQIFIYPLEKDQRKRALEEGPLPFLFNMKAAEAEKRYRMRLARETKDSFIIQVIPLLDIDKESFSWAQVQLSWIKPNNDYLLPVRIVLVGPDGKSTKDYQLPRITPNAAVEDANFRGFVPKAKDRLGKPIWTVHRPGDDDAQAPRLGNAPAGAPPEQPAARGRLLRRQR